MANTETSEFTGNKRTSDVMSAERREVLKRYFKDELDTARISDNKA